MPDLRQTQSMTPHDLSSWMHSHAFGSGNPVAEKGAMRVFWLTFAMMWIEIFAGWYTHSMALLADGWHMSSHVLAIGLAALAYRLARRYANDERFAFGTWKIEVLAGFSSALALGGIAVLMAFESGHRLIRPESISFDQAMVVAVLGLIVNLVSAKWLHMSHHDSHDHDHDHDHDHNQQPLPVSHVGAHEHSDLNHRAAYLHVLADAATSLLAIVALMAGKWLGWAWLDPLMGLVGGFIVGVWAVGLLRQTASALLDRSPDLERKAALKGSVQAIDGGDVMVADVHVWRVGPSSHAAILSLVTHREDLTPQGVRDQLGDLRGIAHLTIEINHCKQCD
jgi:cation diffusion facilitator family transporter